MYYKIEYYTKKRFKMHDDAYDKLIKLDNLSNKESIKYCNEIEKKLEKEIGKLDKSYINKLTGTFILRKNNENDIWQPYEICQIYVIDCHNCGIVLRKISKNFKKCVEKSYSLRKGIYKSVTINEVMGIFGWEKPAKQITDYDERYLYFFQNELGRIKIGRAENVENRLKGISSQAGIKIYLLNKIENAAKYEFTLHELFKEFKYSGEWFVLNNSQIEWICSLNKKNIKNEIDSISNSIKI
jgi:hypothetical protein